MYTFHALTVVHLTHIMSRVDSDNCFHFLKTNGQPLCMTLVHISYRDYNPLDKWPTRNKHVKL